MVPLSASKPAEQRVDDMYTEYRELVQRENGFPDWNATQQEPGKGDAENFLAAFYLACDNERKKDDSLKNLRTAALSRIQAYVDAPAPSANCTGFPRINRYRLAIELALRVRRPRVIDQCGAVLCASASVVQGFFKTNPVAAVKFTLEIADNGHAMLLNRNVDPPTMVKTTLNNFNQSPVDWLLLASTRYHFEPLVWSLELIKGPGSVDPLRQYTKPGLLVYWLKQMGYQHVKDRTFGSENFSTVAKIVNAVTRYPMHDSDRSSKVGEQNLQKAIQDLNLGRLVFVWAYGDLSSKAKKLKPGRSFPAPKGTPQQEETDEGFPALHWTLVRKLAISGSNVNIRLYTWGDTREASFDKDEFLDVYLGHVVAEP